MCDKLVFDLSQEIEGSPNVFVRKDWINILDNQNQNYNNNQSVIDTSQLSNSNKYMSYREAYFTIPFLVTLCTAGAPTRGGGTPGTPNASPALDWATGASSGDYGLGLKNWFGQIIHSFTLDYNGTTIIQQTPFINMWNSFKLMTSLSYGDIITQGATIGFYPDDPKTWVHNAVSGTQGVGVCNNSNYNIPTAVTGAFAKLDSDAGNIGFLQRQQLINFDTGGVMGGTTLATMIAGGDQACKDVWKSYISTKISQALSGATFTTQDTPGVIQYSIVATVYLKHIHSFFNMCPLLKGVFMKMTMNLNNTTTSFSTVSASAGNGDPLLPSSWPFASITVSNPMGGVNPLMLASASGIDATDISKANGGASLFLGAVPQKTIALNPSDTTYTQPFYMNISVGARVLDSSVTSVAGVTTGSMAQSVYLYIPAYTFNPTFESAYLSSPVKQIKYTDVYQYQVLNIASTNTFNNLITNGIANIKSVLILPYYSTATNTFKPGVPVWQSPFDPAGTGPTSPMCWLTNFNVQISGQNAIYNVERYNFEQFNNQLYGQNAVNGGLTDGITSGLIDRQAFDLEYCYYYVNVERMLPVEQSVPKSVQILGQNKSAYSLDLLVFVEYGCEIAIDALTGARV